MIGEVNMKYIKGDTMKRLILGLLLLVSFNVNAQEIVVSEARKAIVKYKIEDVDINVLGESARVNIGLYDEDGVKVDQIKAFFTNHSEFDEQGNETVVNDYSTFITYVEINPAKLRLAVKTKLGK